MNTDRQGDRVFRYVRDILSTRHLNTGAPAVFGLSRVSNATDRFTSYLGYLLADEPEPRTGELKRAVREIFEETGNSSIGDGSVPRLEGCALSSEQVAELAYHVIALDEQVSASSAQKWPAVLLAWKSYFVTYNGRHGDLWDGFRKTSLAREGAPVIIYRMFLLASGITRGARFDPARQADHALPMTNTGDLAAFRRAADGNADYLNAALRTKIWQGFLHDGNRHYLAGSVPKPRRKPSSSASLLEMFDSYFNCREYTYDRRRRCIAAPKGLKMAWSVTSRYWHMIGSIALGPLVCINANVGCWTLLLLLILWRNQRHSTSPSIYMIPYWGPLRTVAYVAFCAFADSPGPIALMAAIPIAAFAAHIGGKWSEMRASA